MCSVTPSSPFKAAENLVKYGNERRANPSLPVPPGVTAFQREGASDMSQPFDKNNPMSLAMAGKAASIAGDTAPPVKTMKIADSFLGTTDMSSSAQKSGYKVVK